MARGVDLTSLTPAERTVFVGGGALFANGFIPWWFRTTTIDGTITYNAGLTDPTVVAVAAGALAAVAVLARAMIWPEPAPRRDALLYLAFGLAGVGAVIVALVAREGVWLGTWAAAVLAAIVVLGGVRRTRERQAGWR